MYIEFKIALYDENGVLLQEEPTITLNIDRRLTKSEKKEAWYRIKRDLLNDLKSFYARALEILKE